MRVRLTYDDQSRLSPAALGRLLVDIDAIFYLAGLAGEELSQRGFRWRFLSEWSYREFVYLGLGRQEDREKHITPPNIQTETRLHRVVYSSPPRVTVSIRASLDVQKIAHILVEFIKYLLTLGEQRDLLRIKVARERGDFVMEQMKRFGDIQKVLNNIRDEELRAELEIALATRIAVLLDESGGYPKLRRISAGPAEPL